MRILVISDVHANLTALEAVLASAKPFDTVWCLGDLVDYGPDPNECVERIRSLPNLYCVMGNHEAAVLGLLPDESFNSDARKSARWTHDRLNASNREYLQNLPESLTVDIATLVHGSPRFPIWEYILDTWTATENFESFDTQLCLIGHSHVPVAFFSSEPDGEIVWSLLKHESILQLDGRAILNPGSVGQPRDGDPRASYAIFEPENNTWQNIRVDYDIKGVQKRILKAGLPRNHATRLSSGA
ncbi:MAG: metallophosphoesterase family protein [Anaerolineaceae bacterium]